MLTLAEIGLSLFFATAVFFFARGLRSILHSLDDVGRSHFSLSTLNVYKLFSSDDDNVEPCGVRNTFIQ